MPRGKAKKKAAPKRSLAVSAPQSPPIPIVVIHGGPASNLLDLYPTTPDDVFTLSRGFLHFPSAHKRYERLPFHPDDPATTLNTTGKTLTPARLAAINAFYLPYENLVETLKTNVGTQDDPAPVFPMAYDWRFDSSASVLVLASFIEEVIRIVSRLPRYIGTPPRQVDIVAHSFGGLVTARYLRWSQQQNPTRQTRVRKVVTIASPFRGAVDALYTMIKDQDQKETARTLPAVFGLLPYFEGACVDKSSSQTPLPSIDLLTHPTIFKNSSVEKTLDEYCKRMASTKGGAARLEELRRGAREQRDDFAALNVAAALGSADNWLPIVGIGNKTNVQAQVVTTRAGGEDAEFAFENDNHGDRTGDNTVPFLGAIPPFNLATGVGGSPTPRERLVCVMDDDADPGEHADWFGAAEGLGLASLHSFLPRMNAVQAIIFGFLREVPPRFRAKAHPAPGVLPQNVTWPVEKWNVEPI
jgi:pimeloyl-ACP methyl ester carboxylesterase